MRRIIISKKLDELYKKEQYHPVIQTRPKPKAGITGEEPEETDLEKDTSSKSTENNNKKSEPKIWKFKGPHDSVNEVE